MKQIKIDIDTVQDYEHQKVVWVKNNALAGALFHEGIPVRKIVHLHPNLEVQYLFLNTPQVNDIIKKFKKKTLRVEPNKYLFEMEHAEYTGDVLKCEIVKRFKKTK